MTQTARVYKIELLIRNRGCVSFAALLEELEVSRATLKRDLAYLRDQLGAPIEYDRDRNGYVFGAEYRGQKHELPGLWFDERELYSLLMAHQVLSELDSNGVLARHLQPLLERIHAMLGAEPGEGGASALLKRVRILNTARRPVSSRFFELVADGLLNRRRLRLNYLTRSRAERGEREVSPQRLVHFRNTWYLDAWCHRSDGLRRFSLDAIEEAALLDTKAREVAIKTLEAEMDAGYGIWAGAQRRWATLRFEPRAAQWVSREEWHPEQRGRWLDDGAYELQVPFSSDTELAMDVLRHGPEVTVLAPASLLREFVRQLDAARQRYDV